MFFSKPTFSNTVPDKSREFAFDIMTTPASVEIKKDFTFIFHLKKSTKIALESTHKRHFSAAKLGESRPRSGTVIGMRSAVAVSISG